jgi:hypothetical protein
MPDLIKRLLNAAYDERITRDELEVLREHLKHEIPGLSTEQLAHLSEIRYRNALQNRIEAEQAALAVPGAEPPPPWIRHLLEGHADTKLDSWVLRNLAEYLEQEIPGLTRNQRLHLSKLVIINEDIQLRRAAEEADTNEVFARLAMSTNRPGEQKPNAAEDQPLPVNKTPKRQRPKTPTGVAAPKRKPTRKPPASRPKTLKELAAAIRSKSPRGRNVPSFIEMMDRLITDDHPVTIDFDDIRLKCHAEGNVDGDAVEKTIKRARDAIRTAGLPYTVSQSGYTVVVQKTP